MSDIGSLTINLVGNASSLRRALYYSAKDIERFANQTDKGMSAAETSIKALDRALVAMSASAATALGAAAASFASFDDSIRRATALLGKGVTDPLRKEMASLAIDVSTKSRNTAKEIGDIYYYLISAGYDAQQSMKALATVENFTMVSGMKAGRAAEVLSDSMFSLGLNAKDAAENTKNLADLADILTYAASRSDATVEQMAETMSAKAGPALRMYGISLKEGAALAMGFANAGIKGKQAGTWMSIFLRDINQAVLKKGSAWKNVGIELFDKGKMRHTYDVLRDLNMLMSRLTDSQKKSMMQQLGFNTRSEHATLAIMDHWGFIEDSMKNVNKEAKGFVDTVKGNWMDSFSSKFMEMTHSVQGVFLEFGNQGGFDFLKGTFDAIKEAALALRKALQSFESLNVFVTMAAQLGLFVMGLRTAFFLLSKMKGLGNLLNPFGGGGSTTAPMGSTGGGKVGSGLFDLGAKAPKYDPSADKANLLSSDSLYKRIMRDFNNVNKEKLRDELELAKLQSKANKNRLKEEKISAIDAKKAERKKEKDTITKTIQDSFNESKKAAYMERERSVDAAISKIKRQDSTLTTGVAADTSTVRASDVKARATAIRNNDVYIAAREEHRKVMNILKGEGLSDPDIRAHPKYTASANSFAVVKQELFIKEGRDRSAVREQLVSSRNNRRELREKFNETYTARMDKAAAAKEKAIQNKLNPALSRIDNDIRALGSSFVDSILEEDGKLKEALKRIRLTDSSQKGALEAMIQRQMALLDQTISPAAIKEYMEKNKQKGTASSVRLKVAAEYYDKVFNDFTRGPSVELEDKLNSAREAMHSEANAYKKNIEDGRFAKNVGRGTGAVIGGLAGGLVAGPLGGGLGAVVGGAMGNWAASSKEFQASVSRFRDSVHAFVSGQGGRFSGAIGKMGDLLGGLMMPVQLGMMINEMILKPLGVGLEDMVQTLLNKIYGFKGKTDEDSVKIQNEENTAKRKDFDKIQDFYRYKKGERFTAVDKSKGMFGDEIGRLINEADSIDASIASFGNMSSFNIANPNRYSKTAMADYYAQQNRKKEIDDKFKSMGISDGIEGVKNYAMAKYDEETANIKFQKAMERTQTSTNSYTYDPKSFFDINPSLANFNSGLKTKIENAKKFKDDAFGHTEYTDSFDKKEALTQAASPLDKSFQELDLAKRSRESGTYAISKEMLEGILKGLGSAKSKMDESGQNSTAFSDLRDGASALFSDLWEKSTKSVNGDFANMNKEDVDRIDDIVQNIKSEFTVLGKPLDDFMMAYNQQEVAAVKLFEKLEKEMKDNADKILSYAPDGNVMTAPLNEVSNIYKDIKDAESEPLQTEQTKTKAQEGRKKLSDRKLLIAEGTSKFAVDMKDLTDMTSTYRGTSEESSGAQYEMYKNKVSVYTMKQEALLQKKRSSTGIDREKAISDAAEYTPKIEEAQKQMELLNSEALRSRKIFDEVGKEIKRAMDMAGKSVEDAFLGKLKNATDDWNAAETLSKANPTNEQYKRNEEEKRRKKEEIAAAPWMEFAQYSAKGYDSATGKESNAFEQQIRAFQDAANPNSIDYESRKTKLYESLNAKADKVSKGTSVGASADDVQAAAAAMPNAKKLFDDVIAAEQNYMSLKNDRYKGAMQYEMNKSTQLFGSEGAGKIMYSQGIAKDYQKSISTNTKEAVAKLETISKKLDISTTNINSVVTK